MSSCSWAKHRYQWVKAHLPTAGKAAHGASLVRIQPSKAQQAEAGRLLGTLQRQQAATARSKEQELTRQLMQPEHADAAPADRPLAAPQEAVPHTPAPQIGYPLPNYRPHISPQPIFTQPTFPQVAYPQPTVGTPDPYVGTRFVPRDAPLMPDQQTVEVAPPQPDAAQLRGLRSPTLPQALPMDIDGKLRTNTTR